jgi:hypothetical protein
MSLPQTFIPPTFTKALPIQSNLPSLPEDILPRSFLKALSDAYHRTHISHALSLYLADIFSATRHHARLDATLLAARASKDAEVLVRASRVIGADLIFQLSGLFINILSFFIFNFICIGVEFFVFLISIWLRSFGDLDYSFWTLLFVFSSAMTSLLNSFFS